MEDLRTKLQAAHDEIETCRRALFLSKGHAIEAKEDLKNVEAGLILKGVPGKNEGERTAYLRQETIGSRTRLLEVETEERKAIMDLEFALDVRRLWENMMNLEMMGDA
jgi:hypothetical protein